MALDWNVRVRHEGLRVTEIGRPGVCGEELGLMRRRLTIDALPPVPGARPPAPPSLLERALGAVSAMERGEGRRASLVRCASGELARDVLPMGREELAEAGLCWGAGEAAFGVGQG